MPPLTEPKRLIFYIFVSKTQYVYDKREVASSRQGVGSREQGVASSILSMKSIPSIDIFILKNATGFFERAFFNWQRARGRVYFDGDFKAGLAEGAFERHGRNSEI